MIVEHIHMVGTGREVGFRVDVAHADWHTCGASPIIDVEDAKVEIVTHTGMRSGGGYEWILTMGTAVYADLVSCQDLVNRFIAVNQDIRFNTGFMAAVLDVELLRVIGHRHGCRLALMERTS